MSEPQNNDIMEWYEIGSFEKVSTRTALRIQITNLARVSLKFPVNERFCKIQNIFRHTEILSIGSFS